MSQSKFTSWHHYKVIAKHWRDVCIDIWRGVIHNELHIYKIIKENEQMLNTRDIEELKGRIQAMTDEELEVVVENIPVDMCLKRINDEIEKGRRFKKYIDDAMKLGSV